MSRLVPISAATGDTRSVVEDDEEKVDRQRMTSDDISAKFEVFGQLLHDMHAAMARIETMLLHEMSAGSARRTNLIHTGGCGSSDEETSRPNSSDQTRLHRVSRARRPSINSAGLSRLEPSVEEHTSRSEARAALQRNNSHLGSVGTEDVYAAIQGAEGALRVLAEGEHSGVGISSSLAAKVETPASRWQKSHVRSGRRQSASSIETMLLWKTGAITVTGRMIIHSSWFGWLCGVIIFCDAMLIAVETDGRARRGEVDKNYRTIGHFFSVWYVVELSMRIAFHRRPKRSFFFGRERAWNWLDIFLIGASAVEIILEQLESMRIRVVLIGRVLRTVRLFRVVRVLRIIRLLTFLREFYKLVLCLASSLQTLVCAMSLMTFVIFCFSVLFVQLVTQHLETGPDFIPSSVEEEDLLASFGTVSRSMISLYMAMTAGRNWGELADLLMWVDPELRAIFFVFLACAIFGLTNVVTAVFVESAMQATRNYRDLRIQEMMLKERANVKHMKEIFRSIDADNSGSISLKEMQAYMEDETLKLQEYFEALELSASDTYTLFRLLDLDGSGEVDIDEFCDGCMRLGGSAKSFDMNCMWYEQRRTNKELLKFIQHACVCLYQLSKESGLAEKNQLELLKDNESARRVLGQQHFASGARTQSGLGSSLSAASAPEHARSRRLSSSHASAEPTGSRNTVETSGLRELKKQDTEESLPFEMVC
mmetsp:Transcript_41947/g.96261  ORF Transcript_41947/g.96261 Transcript_41947/m.96261 type:complete len:709 (-) Transcript_41947:145-2271(-)